MDTREFVILEATPADLDALEALEDRLFTEEAFTRSELVILIQHPRSFFRVAWAGAVIAGYVSAYSVREVGYIASIAVDAPFQRRGLGTRLLEMTHDEFRRRGASAIKLHVRVTNTAAVALYRKHGYVVEKAIPDYYGYNAPGLLMSLLLEK